MAENPAPRSAMSTRRVVQTRKKQTPDADDRTYTCQVCSRTFGSSKALRSHCVAKHEVRFLVCDKGFVNNAALQQHAYIHEFDVILENPGGSNNEQVVTLQDLNEEAVERENTTMSVGMRESVIIQGIETIDLNDDKLQQMLVTQEQELVQKDGLLHKTNRYTLLPDTEHETIYQSLLAACHAVEILDAEQYTLQSPIKRKNHTNVPYSEFRQTPKALNQPKRKVVAIDCEMVGLWKNVDCVALVCAVDVLTGETLLNTYVDPVSRVQAWRSTVSGVTRQAMANAIGQGQALRGWAAARKALWKHIDVETIIVGHALQNDLNVLGIFHPRIVDTAILASQAVFPETRGRKFPESYGLKRLLLSWLNMSIQTGKKGHDCLEDTLATRELAIWCARNSDSLKSWGSQMRIAYQARKLAIQRAREESKKRAKEAGNEDAKDDATKVVITDAEKNAMENSKLNDKPEARQESRQRRTEDAKRDAINDDRKDTRKYTTTNSRHYARKDVRRPSRENGTGSQQKVKGKLQVDPREVAIKTNGGK